MNKVYLGEFQELVLTLVAALRDDAYGAATSEEIANKLKREVTLSAVHVTRYSLEDKGLVKSRTRANGVVGGREFLRSPLRGWSC